MNIQETPLAGCYILEPKIFQDDRGCFFESFNQAVFEKAIGKSVHFVQDNQSLSSHGVLRGLHAQLGEHAQAKLVRVLSGSVLDVAVDARVGSPSFGHYFSIELSAENKKQLFIPRGFYHGFVVLSESAEFFYKCDNFYHSAAESGIMYNDNRLGIDWQLPTESLILSEKDLKNKSFDEVIRQQGTASL